MGEGLLEVGDRAPEFEAETSDGGRIRLREVLADRAALLMFYPVDDTPGCTRQMCLARDEGSAYEAAGVARFGVNPGSAESHRHFSEKHALDFPLIVDRDGAVARAFGVPLVDGYVSRATVLVGRDGRIAFAMPGTRGAAEVIGALDG
jgi:thioredoxin-dependent peroxiredoxin